jgi:hypothetical protein
MRLMCPRSNAACDAHPLPEENEMRHHVRYAALVSAAGLIIACTDDTQGPTSPVNVMAATKAVGGKIVNPRAIFTYYHFTTGIEGDGRSADGSGVSATESVYEDGRCGVTSEIFASGSRDATMDPIGSRAVKNCVSSVPRTLTVRWGTPIVGVTLVPAQGGHFSNVRAVLDIAVGAPPIERLFTLLLRGSHTCERVRYDADVTYTVDGTSYEGSKVLVSRVSEGEWLAESQPNSQGKHVAFCQVGGTGGVGDFYDPGTQLGVYEMPLRVRVRQK